MSRNRRRRPSLTSVVFMMILFDISAFAILIMNSETFDPLSLVAMAATVLLLIFQYFILSVFFPNCDRTVLVIANFLVSVGLIIQFRISPSVAMKQLVWIGIGMVCMIVTTLAIRRSKIWPTLWKALIVLSVLFLASAVVLGSEKFGASNWINLGPFSFQPSEFVKIGLIFFFSWFLQKNQEKINRPSVLVTAAVLAAAAILLSTLLLPMWFCTVTYCVSATHITRKCGIFFIQEQVMRTQALQFSSIFQAPFADATGMNFIPLHAYGGTVILSFLSSSDAAEIQAFLQKTVYSHSQRTLEVPVAGNPADIPQEPQFDAFESAVQPPAGTGSNAEDPPERSSP